MTCEALYVLRNTPGVTGFIGTSVGGATPIAVSPEEIVSRLRRMGLSDQKIVVDFGIGEHVNINNGPFKGMDGVVESMNDETQSAIVLIVLFGRETPTEIAYMDLSKV